MIHFRWMLLLSLGLGRVARAALVAILAGVETGPQRHFGGRCSRPLVRFRKSSCGAVGALISLLACLLVAPPANASTTTPAVGVVQRVLAGENEPSASFPNSGGKFGSPGSVIHGALYRATTPTQLIATKAVVEEGTYVVKTAQGEYVGQSGAISRRLQQHVGNGKFTKAEVDAAERARVTGGKLQREIAEQL